MGQIERLGDKARRMRNEPTEPEKRLWRSLSNSQLGHKIRRQSVIGHFIVDFLCPSKALIIEIDGDTHDAGADQRRDALLSNLGYRTIRFTNADVMSNIDGVLDVISRTLSALPDRWPHPNPAGRLFALSGGEGCCPAPEGEGLSRLP